MQFVKDGSYIDASTTCRETASSIIRSISYDTVDIKNIRGSALKPVENEWLTNTIELFNTLVIAVDRLLEIEDLPQMKLSGTTYRHIKDFHVAFGKLSRPLSSFFLYFPRIIKISNKDCTTAVSCYNIDGIMEDCKVCDELKEFYRVLAIPYSFTYYGGREFWSFANHIMTTKNTTVLVRIRDYNGYIRGVRASGKLLKMRDSLPTLGSLYTSTF